MSIVQKSAEVFTVGFRDSLVPEVTVFQTAFSGSVEVIVIIHIDEAVSLFDLGR